jgi:hypothetical protein
VRWPSPSFRGEGNGLCLGAEGHRTLPGYGRRHAAKVWKGTGETLLRGPRRAKAAPISRMAKWLGAPERDGSGRSSGDARGQHNPGRAKDPWGLWSRCYGENGPDMPKGQPEQACLAARDEGAGKQVPWQRLPDPAMDDCEVGSGRPALTAGHMTLEPYWGKPTVRNLRGGAGNGAMAARGGHSAERAELRTGLAKPERHRACALLDPARANDPANKVRQLGCGSSCGCGCRRA